MMERIVYIARLKLDMVQGYKEAHQQVWPELIEAGTRAGIRNHSCFVRGNAVIIYLETEDYAATARELSEKDVVKRWNAYMADYFDGSIQAQQAEPWEEVFHMD